MPGGTDPVENFMLDYCVLDGEKSDESGIVSDLGTFKDDVTFSNNEFKDIIIWALINFANTAVQVQPLSIVTFANILLTIPDP